ncbi:hypothetical protein ACFVP8_08440 [Viridibacillus arvi]|uniref:hypothetical protein n=1 Tax=Viridibacillus arvi TaxID=263475 RepID=UPI003683CAAA
MLNEIEVVEFPDSIEEFREKREPLTQRALEIVDEMEKHILVILNFVQKKQSKLINLTI